MTRAGRALALIQAGYLLVTGLWPLVWMAGFLAVTGPKQDLWLVRTVGALAVVIGSTLLIAGLRASIGPEIGWLGSTTALAFLLVDVVGWATGVLGPVYLADGLVEALLLAGWVWIIAQGSLAKAPDEHGSDR